MKIYHPICIGTLLTSIGAIAQTSSYDPNSGRPTEIHKNLSASNAFQHKVFETFKDDVNLYESNANVYKSPTEIKVLKESMIYVTYINEETDGNGTLAYFTFKTGTSPDASAKATLKPIFPRINNSVLAYGDMVALGSFKPGTSIGFVLLKNGWTGNTINYTGSKIYSTDAPKAVATALDPESQTIVMGFEENVSSGISDINDVLIGVHAADKAALKTQSFASLTTSAVAYPDEVAPQTPTPADNATANASSYYGCFHEGMSESDYNSSLKLIRSTNDDVNKIKIIKSNVEHAKITPEQAKTYCLQLSNYSHRFEMAKYLFNYLCEKDRASILGETFKNTNYEKAYLSFVNDRLKEERARSSQHSVQHPSAPATPQNQTVIIVDPNSGYGQGYPHTYPQRGIPFSQNEMNHLLAQMHNATFDSNMDNLVRAAVIGRVLSTYQIRQILSEFSFDNYRLNIAKYLYDFTYDTHVYYTLSSTFTFARSQRDFLDFVRSRGNRVY